MGVKVKLHLGSGFVYEPSSINIDKFDVSVADELCDAGDLPFNPNTVDEIEALQLLEHFDYIHCKYVLSEWFRVLKPEGILTLETPDLERTFKNFHRLNHETQKTALQWVYGIDSPGMQHKTGVTQSLLRDLLGEIGFEEFSMEEVKTHRYEAGLRCISRKPKDHFWRQLFACYRKNLKNRLRTDDSYVLIPLENWLEKIPRHSEEAWKDKKRYLDEVISKTAVCNPLVPLTFLETCIDFGFVGRGEVEDEIDLLNRLAEAEFHKRVFSLWMRSKKDVGRVGGEFESFLGRLRLLIRDLLTDPATWEERLRYILELEPFDIRIFDFNLVLLEAKKALNVGVKQFHKGRFSKALDDFSRSSMINPDDPLLHWNLARLHSALKSEKRRTIEEYEKALSLTENKKWRSVMEAELSQARGGENPVPRGPIGELL